MRLTNRGHNAFRTPWDEVLGVVSHVRALRVLDATTESMSIRELGRRAGVQLRAVQIAVTRLEGAGVLERVGIGARQQVRLRRSHPLAPALAALFAAEAARVQRTLEGIKNAAKAVPQVESAWLEGSVAVGTDTVSDVLVLGLLARSTEVDAAVDALRASLSRLMSDEDLHIQVQGWTRADLEVGGKERVRLLQEALPVLGRVPVPVAPPAKRRPGRSHAEADADLLHRGRAISAALAKRPELVAQARAEVLRRLEVARPQEARTMREWLQLLDALSLTRLRRFLEDPGEQPTRLRQSLPLVFLRALEGPVRERDR